MHKLGIVIRGVKSTLTVSLRHITLDQGCKKYLNGKLTSHYTAKT